MSENPYQSPQEPAAAVGVLSGAREDLRSVAVYQKVIVVCILIYLIAVVGQLLLPAEIGFALAIAGGLAAIVGAIFVFLLAMKVYGTGLGILFGILTLVPLIGLIVLLVVNGKATSVLKQNGIAVGLLGANLSQV